MATQADGAAVAAEVVLEVWFDGGCHPNPNGTACYGWVARAGRRKQTGSGAIPPGGPVATTNNVAEYAALKAALAFLTGARDAGKLAGITRLVVRGDSQLVGHQV